MTAWPGLLPVGAVVSGVDDVHIVLPNKVVSVTRLCSTSLLLGVCQSFRLLMEVELAEVFLVPVDGSPSFPLSPVFGKEVM